MSIVDNRTAFEKALAALQDDAIGTILDSGGVSAVFEFAEAVELPGLVGESLARRGQNLDEVMLCTLEKGSTAAACAALCYFGHRFGEFGWEGIDRLRADHGPSPRVAADLLRAAHPVELPWRRLDGLDPEVSAEYWARVGFYEIGPLTELTDLLEVSRRLREAGRIDLLLEVLGRGADLHGSEPEFAVEAAACLEEWIQLSTDELAYGDMTGWELTNLVNVLDTHRKHLGSERVVDIEWLYYPILRNDPDFNAPNLYGEMARNPEYFVFMVESFMKVPNGDEPQWSEQQRQVAVNAFRVLHSWPSNAFKPGNDGEVGIDAVSLNEWTDRARELLRESDRADIGDQMIGTALAASPPGPDGSWPSVAVCELIERLESDQLERGLDVAIQNQRGVTVRSPAEGGEQERQLASHYTERSKQLSEWPRTAAIFKGLALDYKRIAEMHDQEAEANRRSLPL